MLSRSTGFLGIMNYSDDADSYPKDKHNTRPYLFCNARAWVRSPTWRIIPFNLTKAEKYELAQIYIP